MAGNFNYLTPEQQAMLRETANKMVAPGKGILAADEPNDSLGERLLAVGVENCEESRRKYR